MSFSHRLLTITVHFPGLVRLPQPKTNFHAISLTCLSCFSLSLHATGFPVTPPEPGPAPSLATGFRPSGLCTPISPGVPTGARNLGVCVSLCFAPNLCYRLFRVLFPNLHSRPLFHTCRFALNLYYHPRSFPPHPLLPPPYFRLPLLLTYPRVSPAHFLPIPTDHPRLPPIRGPPEKVGKVNRAHRNRACPA